MIPASSPSAPYSSAECRGQEPCARAERPQDRRLVDPLELGHRHGADENQDAAQERDAADNRDPEHTLSTMRLNPGEDFAAVDGRHVRELSRPGRAGAAPAPSGPPGLSAKPTNVCGASASTPGRNTNMKPPARDSRPLDVADARHLRRDRPAKHVEPHLVADIDVEALVDALFDRDFGR